MGAGQAALLAQEIGEVGARLDQRLDACGRSRSARSAIMTRRTRRQRARDRARAHAPLDRIEVADRSGECLAHRCIEAAAFPSLRPVAPTRSSAPRCSAQGTETRCRATPARDRALRARARLGELPGLAAEFAIAMAALRRELGASMVAMISSACSAVRKAPSTKCLDRDAAPFPAPELTDAPAPRAQTGQSAAGSAWARLPPMVPRLRTER